MEASLSFSVSDEAHFFSLKTWAVSLSSGAPTTRTCGFPERSASLSPYACCFGLSFFFSRVCTTAGVSGSYPFSWKEEPLPPPLFAPCYGLMHIAPFLRRPKGFFFSSQDGESFSASFFSTDTFLPPPLKRLLRRRIRFFLLPSPFFPFDGERASLLLKAAPSFRESSQRALAVLFWSRSPPLFAPDQQVPFSEDNLFRGQESSPFQTAAATSFGVLGKDTPNFFFLSLVYFFW